MIMCVYNIPPDQPSVVLLVIFVKHKAEKQLPCAINLRIFQSSVTARHFMTSLLSLSLTRWWVRHVVITDRQKLERHLTTKIYR